MMATSLAPGGIPPFPEFLTEATMFVTRPSTIAHAERAGREVLVPIYEASQLCNSSPPCNPAAATRPPTSSVGSLHQRGIRHPQRSKMPCVDVDATLARFENIDPASVAGLVNLLAGSPPPKAPPPFLAVWQAFGVWQTFCPYPYTLYEEARKPNPKRFPNGLPNSGCSCPKPSSGV